MKRLVLSLALLMPPVYAAGADLPGRLFFTPQQRAVLDRTRGQAARPVAPGSQAITGSVTFNGFVKPSDGRPTLWLNDKPLSGKDLPPGYAIAPDQPAALKLPGQKGQVRLKPGQSLDPASGKIVERYQNTPQPVTPETPAPTTPRRAEAHDAADPDADH
jgi:hypothetical protein